MVDITNREDLFKSLANLDQETIPVFGIMTPQHMVEHLAFAVKFSNGKLPQKLYVPLERAQVIKRYILGEGEHPIGFKSPLLGEGLEPLLTSDLDSSIQYLKSELIAFDNYFRANPEATFTSPMLGDLSHAEWIGYHNKHFSHHFKQFGLVSV